MNRLRFLLGYLVDFVVTLVKHFSSIFWCRLAHRNYWIRNPRYHSWVMHCELSVQCFDLRIVNHAKRLVAEYEQRHANYFRKYGRDDEQAVWRVDGL